MASLISKATGGIRQTLRTAAFAWQTARMISRSPKTQTKAAPFLWPAWRVDRPLWQLINYMSYVNEGFNLNSLIYSAIMYKAKAQILAPMRAWTGSIDNPDPLDANHPLSKLLMRPNPHQSQAEFQQQGVVYRNVSGDRFILMDRPTVNVTPEAMWNLRPDRVLILPGVVDGIHTIRGYLYVPEGRSEFLQLNTTNRAQAVAEGRATVIDPVDMMHVKFPNPGDPLEGMGYGLSPISSMARSADVDNAITHFLKLFFDHGVMLPGILKSEQPLDDPTMARIKERWKDMYGGYFRWSEEIGVLDAGASYQRIGLSFDEMGFNEQDQRNETRILQALGVPPILVGSRVGLEASTYSNYEEAHDAFWEDQMVPEIILSESDFQFYLNDAKTGAFVANDFSRVPAFQRIKQDQQAQFLDGFKAGGIMRNEYRRKMDLPPVEGGDVFVIQPTMIEVPVALQMDDGSQVGAATSDEEDRKARSVKKKALLRSIKSSIYGNK